MVAGGHANFHIDCVVLVPLLDMLLGEVQLLEVVLIQALSYSILLLQLLLLMGHVRVRMLSYLRWVLMRLLLEHSSLLCPPLQLLREPLLLQPPLLLLLHALTSHFHLFFALLRRLLNFLLRFLLLIQLALVYLLLEIKLLCLGLLDQGVKVD